MRTLLLKIVGLGRLAALPSVALMPALLLAPSHADPATAYTSADQVIVHKGARRLQLLRDGQVLATYRIALGLDPTGHKEREGDFRTPEGEYSLVRRNPNSDFFLSIQVSYPNQEDMRAARRRGWQPGGSIMIHGLPNRPKHPPQYYETRDWTDGCIAVSNTDMVEIWLMTNRNIPISIRP